MNRHLWQQQITPTYCPPWPCPICNKGTLALTKDSVERKEGVRSLRAHDDEGWDPDWIEYSLRRGRIAPILPASRILRLRAEVE